MTPPTSTIPGDPGRRSADWNNRTRQCGAIACSQVMPAGSSYLYRRTMTKAEGERAHRGNAACDGRPHGVGDREITMTTVPPKMRWKCAVPSCWDHGIHSRLMLMSAPPPRTASESESVAGPSGGPGAARRSTNSPLPRASRDLTRAVMVKTVSSVGPIPGQSGTSGRI